MDGLEGVLKGLRETHFCKSVDSAGVCSRIGSRVRDGGVEYI